LPKTADVLIIGAGVIGLSIAYHLARKQTGLHIVVLEKEKMHGAGSTAQCTGGIRHQFTNPLNIQLTKISYPYFLRFAAEMQYPIYFRKNGYLLLTGSATRLQALREMNERLADLNIAAELLPPDEIARRYPFLHTGDLLGGSFCPLDAYADPYGVVEGYYRQCRRLGVEVLYGTQVDGIITGSGEVKGVRAGGADFYAPVVVNAAGPHLHLVARLAGVDIPAAPFRRQVYVCAPLPAVPPGIPLIADLDTGFYLHVEKNGILLLGGTDRDTSPGLQPAVDRSLLPFFVEKATARIPALEEGQITRIYAGIRSLTPDGLGILGETEVSGFYCAGGFGGNGFMHAPAIGMITACLVLGEKPPLDPSPLSPGRFMSTSLADKALF